MNQVGETIHNDGEAVETDPCLLVVHVYLRCQCQKLVAGVQANMGIQLRVILSIGFQICFKRNFIGRVVPGEIDHSAANFDNLHG